MKKLIVAFADTSKDVFDRIKDKSPVAIEHLIKIFCYPESESVNHWKREVAGSLSRVPKLKRTKKFPKNSDILKASWDIWEDSIYETMLEIVDEYNRYTPAKYADIYRKIHKYFIWLASQLESSGYVSSTRISKKIDELQEDG